MSVDRILYDAMGVKVNASSYEIRQAYVVKSAKAELGSREFDLIKAAYRVLMNPNLRRILMWDTYPWHPLRKDFPLAGKEGSPLPPTFEDEDEAGQVIPAPLVGGPFHSPSDGTALFSTQKEPRSVEKFPDNCTEAEQ